ncbi:RnfH family protein [Ignatzschineria sp. LJL83]
MANPSLNQRTFITVEFALALPDTQKIEAQKFQEGITLKEAMPFFSLFHEANKIIEAPQYGVFSIKVEEDYVLKDGDRIEVYRPLIIDPKKARQIRAARDPQFKHKKW